MASQGSKPPQKWVPKPPVPRLSARSLSPLPELPLNVYTEISSHLPLSDQPAFRRANKLTNRAPLLYLHDCTRNPTNSEIATWLLEQQSLIREDIKGWKSQLWDALGESSSINLKLTQSAYDKISFDMNTGNMFLNRRGDFDPLSSFSDIMDVLSKYPLDYWFYNGENNWYIIRGVLKNRLSCFNFEITLFQMLLHVLANNIEYKKEVYPQALAYQLFDFKEFLTADAHNKLKYEFANRFGVPLTLFQSEHPDSWEINKVLKPILGRALGSLDKVTDNIFKLNPEEVNDWLHVWILKLTPDEMKFKKIFTE